MLTSVLLRDSRFPGFPAILVFVFASLRLVFLLSIRKWSRLFDPVFDADQSSCDDTISHENSLHLRAFLWLE